MEEKRKQNIWEGRETMIKRGDFPSGSARLCVFCVPCRSADSGRVGYISLSAQICAVSRLRISQPTAPLRGGIGFFLFGESLFALGVCYHVSRSLAADTLHGKLPFYRAAEAGRGVFPVRHAQRLGLQRYL